MTEKIDDRITRAIDRGFARFRDDVFAPYCKHNDDAHEEIKERLGTLNGFRNKVLGGGALLGFAVPVAVAIWAILVTR